MAEKNVLSRIPTQQMPERQGNFLSRMADEAIGAFERYGRRSGAQRDASLAMLNQAADPNTDPLTGAGMKALGLAGLVTHPLAFFPTREEWDQRLEAAGNTGRMSRSIGGFLSDLPSLIDPQMAAGGAALAAAPLIGKLAGKADDAAGAGIKAFHSSPHSFDKFQMSKIGTGEGAQAYGHGLYAAESPMVSGRGGQYDAQFTAKALGKHDLNQQEAAVLKFMQPGKSDGDVLYELDRGGFIPKLPDGTKDYDQAEMAIKRIRDNKSNIYEINIDASPSELLDWDRPLSEQPEVWSKISGESRLQSQQAILADGDRLVIYAQKAGVPTLVGVKVQSELRKGASLEDAFASVRKLGGSIQDAEKSAKWLQDVDKLKTAIGSGDVTLKGTVPGDWTGARIAKDVPGMKPDEIAETLKARGVKGIRYKDQGSRGTDGGTYNYVVFDDSLITILKKYGIPMTAGAGGAMMVAGQDMPPEFAAQMGGT